MKTLLLLTAAATAARAQFSIPQHVTAAGGGTSRGGGYTLRATIGQASATAVPSAGGTQSQLAGFWAWEGDTAPLLNLSLTSTAARLTWPYLLPSDVALEWSQHLTLWSPLTISGLETLDPLAGRPRRFYRLRIL